MNVASLEHALRKAIAHQQAGRLAEAAAIYRQVLAVQPDCPEAWHLLGAIALAKGNSEEAVRLIRQAIALAPGSASYHGNLGEALRRLGRRSEAIASFRQALTLAPDYPEAHNNLGSALAEEKRWDEAIASFHRALAVKPDYADAHGNLGGALAEMDPQSGADEQRTSDAIASLQRALELQPDAPQVLVNLGLAYWQRREFDVAEQCYRRVLAAHSDFAPAHWNLALLLLLRGRFEEGWKEHEWRWRCANFSSPRRNFSAPQWDGGPAPGETILLHAEQGHGDTIQFLRYVPLVRERARAARVFVECAPELARLLAQTGRWDTEIVARQGWDGAGLPPFDRHLPLLSLPLALEQFEPIVPTEPYLQADAGLRAGWRERLGMRSPFRVGLAWMGNPGHRSDHRRSIASEAIRRLLEVPDVSFYNLQVGAPSSKLTPLLDAGLIDLTAQVADFADTAALIAELDLVISVDTATAHLAGALGVLVWTLLPFTADWRWGLEARTTPWYPSMRLFRQPSPGDWKTVLEQVATELAAACDHNRIRTGSSAARAGAL